MGNSYDIARYGLDVYGARTLGVRAKFGNISPINAVNLAYISIPPILPSSVEVLDLLRADEKNNYGYENINLEVIDGILSTPLGGEVIFKSENILVTNIFHQSGLPLYYKYKTRQLVQVNSEEDFFKQHPASVVMEGGDPLPPGYLYKFTLEPLVSIPEAPNLMQPVVYTNFTGSEGTRFKVRYNPWDSIKNKPKFGYEELLNVRPSFFIAKYADENAVQLIRVGHGFAVQVFDTTKTYAAKVINGPQIFTLSPITRDPFNTWYVRIRRGQLSDGSFWNTDYYKQNFNAYVPIMKSIEEESSVITEHKIQVAHLNILIDPDFPITVTRNGVVVPEIKIKDIDGANGVIELSRIFLSPEDHIKVTYSYLEDYLDYRGYIDMSGQFIHLDVNLNSQHTFTDLWLKQLEQPSTSQAGGIQEPTWKLINNTIHLYYDATRKMMWHQVGNITNVLWADYNKDVEIAQVRLQYQIQDPIVIDTRSRGGGINERVQLPKDARMYWDIHFFDGDPFPMHGSFVVDVNTQNFSRDYILSIANKWKAAGTYPLLTKTSGTLLEPELKSAF